MHLLPSGSAPEVLNSDLSLLCSGFRLEPRLLQQYALQRQSPMPSVRIPPPAHDGGGLYNPFSAQHGGAGLGGGAYGGGGGSNFSDGFSGAGPSGLRDYPMQQPQVTLIDNCYCFILRSWLQLCLEESSWRLWSHGCSPKGGDLRRNL